METAVLVSEVLVPSGIRLEGKSWKVFETQLSSNSEKIHVSMMGYESDLKFNYEMSTYKNKYYIRNNNKPEVVARMVDYFDWCCTDEGIIKSLVGNPGKNYTYDENGKIIGLTSGIPSAIQFVNGQFAYTFILPKYLHSESTYRQRSCINYYTKVYDALHDKNLVNLQITKGPYGPNAQ